MTENLQTLLASVKKPRKVRTPAGAKRYGQPIDSIIMPGGKALKKGDKGYAEADKLLSDKSRAKLPSKAKARIEPKSGIDVTLPLNAVLIKAMSPETLKKSVIEARAKLLSDRDKDATYNTISANMALLKTELDSRDASLKEPAPQASADDQYEMSAKISAKFAKMDEEANKFDALTPVEERQIEDWSDDDLVANFVEARHKVNHDADLSPKKYYVVLDNMIALQNALSARGINTSKIDEHPSIQAKRRAEAETDSAEIKPVRKFQEDTPEQRAADAQLAQTKRELDAREYLSSGLALSAAERRLRTYSKSIPLHDFAAMRRPLAQDGEPTFSDRTEPRELSYKRVNWEMLPQIADYASSHYSEKYAEPIKHYLSSIGSEQVRNQLSGKADNDKAKETIEALDHVTDMDLPENLMLFRGMAVPPDSEIGQLSPGDTFIDPSFVSTSLKRSEAKFFTTVKKDDTNSQKVIFEIETRPGFKGAPLYALGYNGLETDALWNEAFGDEYEILLKREAEFEVKDVTYADETRVIRLIPIAQKDTTIQR